MQYPLGTDQSISPPSEVNIVSLSHFSFTCSSSSNAFSVFFFFSFFLSLILCAEKESALLH